MTQVSLERDIHFVRDNLVKHTRAIMSLKRSALVD